jgi:hypothetical protein
MASLEESRVATLLADASFSNSACGSAQEEQNESEDSFACVAAKHARVSSLMFEHVHVPTATCENSSGKVRDADSRNCSGGMGYRPTHMASKQDETSESKDLLVDNDDDISMQEFLDNIETRIESSDEEFSDVDDSLNEEAEDQTPNLASELLTWACSFGITLVALSALLVVLRVFHPDLPKDARTLLKTPRNIIVKSIENGSYFHFGIFKTLSRSKELFDFLTSYCLPDVPVISLRINIDGLPVSKSGSKQLWPAILARVCTPYSVIETICCWPVLW